MEAVDKLSAQVEEDLDDVQVILPLGAISLESVDQSTRAQTKGMIVDPGACLQQPLFIVYKESCKYFQCKNVRKSVGAFERWNHLPLCRCGSRIRPSLCRMWKCSAGVFARWRLRWRGSKPGPAAAVKSLLGLTTWA
jgi:hypothetical protein